MTYYRFFFNKPFNTVLDRSQILHRYQKCFKCLKEETGLIAIHLFPSSNTLPSCTIIDYDGKTHLVDLTNTSFVIQKKGQQLEATLPKKSLLNLLEKIAIKGFKNRSKRFNKDNFPLIDNKAIMIDLGDTVFVEEQKKPPLKNYQNVKRF